MTGASASGSQTPVVLIVDDESANRDLLCRNLEKGDIRTVTATNGAAAIAAYCRHNPRAVLLDLSMPDVDGFQFLKWRLQEPEEQRAPVIVLTACSDRSSVEQAAALGAIGYIVKPFDGAVVRQRVQSLLAEARQLV